MKQQQFENTHLALWRRFEQLLEDSSLQSLYGGYKISNSQSNSNTATTTNHLGTQFDAETSQQSLNLVEQDQHNYEFVHLYRMICQHYALAKQRHYSPQLVQFLNELVIKGHRQLYQRQSHIWTRIYHFFAYTFPVRLRIHANLFWLSLACFLVPALLMGWACYQHGDMIYSIMSDWQVMQMEEMYNPSNEMVGRDSTRRSDTDIAMFGHYIQNNVGIDFQIYGMGIFAGIGTLFSLVYNGLVIGGVAGHLTGVGFGETFWAFVVGHGSFELTAAVISGAAGLRLAQSLFMPGNYSRLDAFKIAGKQSIELLMGAATMTFIAAFIEAFWSSSSVIPDFIKYIVAVILWVMVISYLLFAGRNAQATRRDIPSMTSDTIDSIKNTTNNRSNNSPTKDASKKMVGNKA